MLRLRQKGGGELVIQKPVQVLGIQVGLSEATGISYLEPEVALHLTKHLLLATVTTF